MTYAPIYFWLLTMLGLLAELALVLIARRRGRDAPWNIPVSYKPPQFTDSRLNSIESFLLVILMPLGILLVIAGLIVALALGSETIGFGIILLGWASLLMRGLFVSACLAFAAIACETTQLQDA